MEFENLIKLIQTMSDSELTGLKYEENGVKIQLSKEKEQVQTVVSMSDMHVPVQAVPTLPDQAETEEISSGSRQGNVVESPLVGTFYTSPSEDSAPFVSVGDKVKKGQTLAIVEAMKLMNEIESDFDGTVAEILAENTQAVEYGQPLFRIV